MASKLDNINLLAKSPISLKDFYIQTFGLRDMVNISHPPGFYMLDANGCRLSIQDAQLVNQSTGYAGMELGFEVDDLENVLAKAEKYGGALVQQKQEMGWGKAFTLTDPEGHIINVYKFNAPR